MSTVNQTMQLHDELQPQRKGDLMVLETRDDSKLFLTCCPLGYPKSRGWNYV
jgi:hypothetical protein